MSKIEALKDSIDGTFRSRIVDNEVAVATGCLFPSNGSVTVYVSGGEQTCVVSDKGATVQVVEAHGVSVPNVSRWLKPFCSRAGLELQGEHIVTPPIDINNVASAISILGNTASFAARYAIDKYSSEVAIKLKDELQRKINVTFGYQSVSSDVEISGASTRTYHFDFMVGNGDKIILFDHVNPHPSSINAKAAAHIDVGRKTDTKQSQYLVYDRSAKWSSADLTFLQSASQLLPVGAFEKAFTLKHSLMK